MLGCFGIILGLCFLLLDVPFQAWSFHHHQLPINAFFMLECMEKSTINAKANNEANNRKMDFLPGSSNAFTTPNGMPFQMSPYLYAGPNGFVPVNANANQFATASSPQQWQSPLVNNPQLWACNVPNVMPWSNGPNSSEGIFSFSQVPPSSFYNSLESIPPTTPSSTEFYPIVNQPVAPPPAPLLPSDQSLPFHSDGSFSTTASMPAMFESSFNQNNKRQVSPLEEDIDVDIDFDFDSKRPVKKYISEDKVLEIFDRLHIREGDHYIVEDVTEETRNTSDFKHNVVIEVLEDDENHILELSPELKNAFQSRSPSITEKLLENERDKLSKAVVVWSPNTILQTLLNDTGDDGNSEAEEGGNEGVQIEEVFSDEDEEMFNCESDIEFIDQVNEEEVDNFDLME